MRLYNLSEQGAVEIQIDEDLRARHEELAERNRERFRARGIRAFDIAGAVGAGKTSLIARLVERLSPSRAVAVIAGDVATTYDAERVLSKGARRVLQINTGGMCHLDARLVHQALGKLDEPGLEVLFIENVGNLICPAGFSLGVEARVVVLSPSEGEHAVQKHPAMFRSAHLVVINKTDIAAAVQVDLRQPLTELRAMRPGLPVVQTNCLAGEGIDAVLSALNLG